LFFDNCIGWEGIRWWRYRVGIWCVYHWVLADLVMDWLDWLGFALFIIGHFMIGSVFADVFSFDALTYTL
jgi:hypothetical protein